MEKDRSYEFAILDRQIMDVCMAELLSDSNRLTVSKAKIRDLGHMGLGVHLTSTTGISLNDLILIACQDRFKFADETLKCAHWAMRARPPKYRVALGRAYYAMYHALRCVVFLVERGDDHEEHKALPKKIPKDFPDRENWENEIKNARLARNQADYDPYPAEDSDFRDSAIATVRSAESFLPVTKNYLIIRGCQL